jgi:hypothetical protein
MFIYLCGVFLYLHKKLYVYLNYTKPYVAMKFSIKQLFFLLVFVSSNLVFGQISITSSAFAVGGDTVRMSRTVDNSIDFQSTGQNYTWDFSNLSPTDQIVKDFRPLAGSPPFINLFFGNFAAAAYKASYYIESTALPVAQLTAFLPVSIDNIYQFSKVATPAVTSLGYSMVVNGTAIPFKSDTIEKRMVLPAAYGDSNYSRGYTSVDFNPVYDAKWKQYRTRTSVVDGYGNITTPYGTFSALRIKHAITEIDSLYFEVPFLGATWIPIPIPNTREYEWWATNEKEPILKITTSIVFGNEVVTAIEYRDVDRGLNANLPELSLDFSIFPNPTQDELILHSDGAFDAIRVLDEKGSVLFLSMNQGTPKTTVSVKEFPAGKYFVELASGSKKGTKSFIKL